MSIRVSHHAIERYQERIDSTVTYNQAYDIISAAMLTASRQKERTFAGDTYYLADNFRLVIAEENGHREVLTVLGLQGENNGRGSGSGSGDIPELAQALHAQFLVWEAKQKLSADELRLKPKAVDGYIKQIEELQTAIRQRQNTIAALLKDRTEARRKAEHANKVEAEYVSRQKYERQVGHANRMKADRQTYYNLIVAIARYVAPSPDADEEDNPITWSFDLQPVAEMIEAAIPGLLGNLVKQ